MLMMIFYLLFFAVSFASEIKYHTLDIGQHDQLPHCINLSTHTAGIPKLKSSGATTLEIVHKQTLCAHRTATSSSSLAEEILHADRLRVKSIQHKMKTNTNTNTNTNTKEERVTKVECLHDDENSTQIPVQSGEQLYDYSDYLVSVGLGTPEKNLHVLLDTGSEVTWTQCKPCLGHCYKQRDRTFNPDKSTTYSNISCTDRECPQSDFGCYKNRTCVYGLEYGDKSYTIGFLAKDKLTLSRNDLFPNFMFGCGHNNNGFFGKIAGILGLNRGNLSIVSQTKQRYGQYFSYFLPSDMNSTGHLTFGKKDNTKDDVKFTSLIFDPQNPLFYFIKIVSITVGKTLLRIPPLVFEKNVSIIDSGTTITYLPHEAYAAMRDEFKRQMNTKLYPLAPAFSILDTCFHVKNDTSLVVFPTVSFTFEGNATVELDRSGVLIVVNSSLVCLAFANNTNLGADIIIFGNTQQKNIEVVYDVAGGKLGFGHPAARG